MPSRSAEAFPFEAVRDLLGIVRAMYAAAKASGAGRAELARIARIGRELTEAMDLARDSRPDTVGYAAAWRRADEASQRVGDLVNALTPAEPMVAAAQARVSGAKLALRKKRPER